jgi:hypothetical protein
MDVSQTKRHKHDDHQGTSQKDLSLFIHGSSFEFPLLFDEDSVLGLLPAPF